MSSRRPEPGADAAAIARASRAVTAQITVAAAAIVLLVVTVSAVFIIEQSRPSELLEKPAPGQTKIYVDAREMFIALVVVGVVAIVLAGLLSWVIARRAVRPLGDALRMQRTFVADASHELRTPVAVVSARVQLLKQEIAAGADPGESIDELQQDVRVLGDVIDDLLLAATPADGGDRIVSVSAVIENTLDDLRILAEERGVSLTGSCDESLNTGMPATTLRRCIVVLVDNAIAHSPAGGVVAVGSAPSGERGTFVITVADQGGGIQGIDTGRLFERFAHGDAPGAAPNVGAGIGLSLVRDIADRYGGGIRVSETSGSGTTFELTLPRL